MLTAPSQIQVTDQLINNEFELLIILYGYPGVGKTSHSKSISKEYGFRRVSTGEILRRNADSIQLEPGQFANNDQILELILADINSQDLEQEDINEYGDSRNLILDGYPRNNEQVDIFLKSFKPSFKDIITINLTCDRQDLISRMTKRGRDDDASDVISSRLDQYDDTTAPAITELISQLSSGHHHKHIEISTKPDKNTVRKQVNNSIDHALVEFYKMRSTIVE